MGCGHAAKWLPGDFKNKLAMSNSDGQSDKHLSEELVAYLDGELSASESESVELRIGQDHHARSELQRFDRVWNALDHLPPVTVSDGFTRTTIEMAAVEAKKELAHETHMLPVKRRQRWLKWTALVAAAVVSGFAALAMLLPNPNRDLYINLPVVMQLDAYSEVRDAEFLRLLDAKAGEWLMADWGPEVAGDAEALANLTTASYRQRRAYVDQLSGDDRTQLASQHRRYQSLSGEMRDELQDWHTALATDPHAPQLQKTMLAYYAWLSQQDEIEQASLRSLSANQRLQRVERMHKEQARRSRVSLSSQNSQALRNAIEAMVADPEIVALHRQMIDVLPDVSKLTPRDNHLGYRVEALQALKRSSPRLAIFMVTMGSAIHDTPPPFKQIIAFRDATEQRMIAALQPQQVERLQSLDQRRRSQQLARWMYVSSRGQRKPDVATLEEFFVSGSLTEDVQQRLLAMPRDQMLKELEQLYIKEFLGEDSFSREFRELMPEYGPGWRSTGRGRRGNAESPPRIEPPRGPRGPRAGRGRSDDRPQPPPPGGREFGPPPRD